ncbi:MAG: hypothetical protein ACRD3M_05285, partial [Thermoanaerobaculia bacterium]
LLAGGIGWSRARERRGEPRREKPARAALWLAALYVLAMLGSGQAGRSFAGRQARALGLDFERLMVGPVPWNPLARMAVFDTGEGYRFATLRLLPRPDLALSGEYWTKGDTGPAARAAAATPAGRAFLTWSRFPAFQVEPSAGSTRVRLVDARYPGPRGSWASVTVEVPRGEGQGFSGSEGHILATLPGGSR